LKEEIIQGVLKFFETKQMPPGVNDTVIVLIPKVDHPQELKEFLPIRLCNFLYKIICKCLVNRVWPILGDVISENQSAFVPGRLNIDKALSVFECLHYMEHGVKAEDPFCAYKQDPLKTYYHVDWVLFGGSDA
jgi:hypothetical protein